MKTPGSAEVARVVLAAILVAATQDAGWGWQADAPAGTPATDQGAVRDVVEFGSVESARSVVVRCEVPSEEEAGRTILQIVPEGTVVKQGDLLVELDSASLEEDLGRSQVVAVTCEAAVRRAQSGYEAAALAKQEFIDGIYPLELQSIRNEIFVAEGELRRTEEELQRIAKLVKASSVPERELDDARFDVAKARNEVDLAKVRLNVLEKFTKPKMLRQAEAEIETAKAELQAETAELELARQEIEQIEDQIKHCTIHSPSAGTVVYENPVVARARSEPVIEEGARVRERQPILRIEDLTQLQVRTKVHESRVRLIRPGMPATITIDALPDVKLTGKVVSIAEYPEPASWITPAVKEYATIVRIDDPTPRLRVGLTARVRIHVSAQSNATNALEGTTRDMRIDEIFKTFDSNRDGRLDGEEFPAAFRTRLRSADSNQDGAIDLAEWRAVQERAAQGED